MRSSNPLMLYGSQHHHPQQQPQPTVSGLASNTNNPLGMGSLQNLGRGVGGSNLALNQLGRGMPQVSQGGSTWGRLTPTIGGSGTSSSNLFSSGGGYPVAGFPSQAVPNSSNRQSTFGMNLLQTSTAGMNSLSSGGSNFSAFSSGAPGGRLYNKDRSGKIDSLLSPNAFDLSEFPSLGNRDNSAPNPVLSARPNYVGMVKQPTMEPSEFTMSNEDFPALPGVNSMSNNVHGNNSLGENSTNETNLSKLVSGGVHHDHGSQSAVNQASSATGSLSGPNSMSSAVVTSATGDSSTNSFILPNSGQQHQQQQQQQSNNVRRGIQTSPDGRVTNIPPSMVTDQFGMIGILTFIRAAETDQNLVSLALGADLTTLGLKLNSEVNQYTTFGGPWAETPCRPQDIDYHVPLEYLTNSSIRDKLAPVKLNRYKDDVLFYMFYTNVGDVLQLAAAAELYNRDWRYHKEDRIWITRAPGMLPSEKTATYERGTYYYFDVVNWRKVSKEFHVDYDKLEDKPPLSSTNPGGGVQQLPPSSSNSPAPPGMPHGIPNVLQSGVANAVSASQLSPVSLSSVAGANL